MAHRLGGFAVAEGADLDVQQLVLGFMPDGHRIPVLLEGGNLDVGSLIGFVTAAQFRQIEGEDAEILPAASIEPKLKE